ncbi:MAG: DNA polymerase III subunit delta' [Candidatus Brocadiia bacterium]
MAFENLKAQPGAIRLLRSALLSGRLPHAYLFVGAQGVGRTDAARQLARVVLCGSNPDPDDFCGSCENCRMTEAGSHPDYHETGVPEGKQLLPISVIREVQHLAGLKPRAAERRFFVIRDAERMTLEAANCFLKTLEEPPGGCVFVLIASSLRDVPETIVSRSRLVRFRNLPPTELADQLERKGMDADEAWWLAHRCWGSPGAAEDFREAELHRFNEELLGRLNKLSLRDNFELSDWLNKEADDRTSSASDARRMLQDLLECVAVYYRDKALSGAGTGEGASFNRDLDATASTGVYLRQAESVLEAIEKVGGNANRTLTLDNLFTEIALRRTKSR